MRCLLRPSALVGYLFGNLVSISGTWAQRVTIHWIAWDMTGSTAVLGLLAALDLLPSVLAAPLAGAIADRRPALPFTIGVQLMSALPPLIMAVVLLIGSMTIPILILLTFVTGILNGLDHPLRLLLVGRVAPQDRISGAVALNSVMFNVGRMIGPALGGWAILGGVPGFVFGYNAATFLLFAGILSRLPGRSEFVRNRENGDSVNRMFLWRDVLRAFDRPLARVFAQFAIIAALIRPIFELLPGFVDDLATNGLDHAQAFSLLVTAQSFGAMVAGFTAVWLLRIWPISRVAMTCGVSAVLANLVFLGSGGFVLSMMAMALLSGTVLLNGIATQVAIQTRLSLEVRGRALSLYTMTFRGLPAMGAVLIGTVAEILSLRVVSASLAVLTFCVMLWIIAARKTE